VVVLQLYMEIAKPVVIEQVQVAEVVWLQKHSSALTGLSCQNPGSVYWCRCQTFYF